MSFEYGEFESYQSDAYLLREEDLDRKRFEIRDLLCLDLDTICAKYGDPDEVTKSKVSKFGDSGKVSKFGDSSKVSKFGDSSKKAHTLVCIPHPSDPLRLNIRKVPRYKTMRVGGKWVV